MPPFLFNFVFIIFLYYLSSSFLGALLFLFSFSHLSYILSSLSFIFPPFFSTFTYLVIFLLSLPFSPLLLLFHSLLFIIPSFSLSFNFFLLRPYLFSFFFILICLVFLSFRPLHLSLLPYSLFPPLFLSSFSPLCLPIHISSFFIIFFNFSTSLFTSFLLLSFRLFRHPSLAYAFSSSHSFIFSQFLSPSLLHTTVLSPKRDFLCPNFFSSWDIGDLASR